MLADGALIWMRLVSFGTNQLTRVLRQNMGRVVKVDLSIFLDTPPVQLHVVDCIYGMHGAGLAASRSLHKYCVPTAGVARDV